MKFKKPKNLTALLFVVGLISMIVALFLLVLVTIISKAFVGGYYISLTLLVCSLIVFIVSIGISTVTTIKDHISAVKAGKKKKLNLCFKVLCALGCIIDFLIVGFITNWDFSPNEAFWIIIAMIIPGIFTQCVYFIPYLIANSKAHAQENAIFVLNLFAGWTLVAWIIALVWACTSPKEKVVIQQKQQLSSADELKKYRELLDSGIITQDEFDAKKNQLLGL